MHMACKFPPAWVQHDEAQAGAVRQQPQPPPAVRHTEGGAVEGGHVTMALVQHPAEHGRQVAGGVFRAWGTQAHV